METKNLELQNSNIAYIDEGTGQPVILLHGFCGSCAYWEKVIPALAENFRVIAVDLPGHGKSAPLQENHAIDDYAAVIEAFMDELKLDQVAMFGHSLGGYITLAFANKFGSRLTAFSLVHSTAYPDSDEAKEARLANVEKVKQEGVRVLIDGLVPKLFSPDNLDKNGADILAAKEIGYSTNPQGAINALIAMKNRPDLNHVLKHAELPVLLIAGEKDQVIPPEKTFSVSKANIKQSLLKDAGHMGMYEKPVQLINEMMGFLASR
ncbi:alpha/beta fold hydrolase [Bacillus sp. T33-2]|uniref:alpha/beta fold hydrolase n=1 Tax=Bacillus sp. T33-2 TaxID=2054168 RepID=UPI000C75A7DB|nr:alpha/beta hydrolase [Bacillus sp. T33-2]PLR91673.1 alpha/beta hydrolase [Bacillus sp. T33-2]